MKKTIITILTLFIIVFANAQSPLEKRIDFSVRHVPIKDALRQLSQEANLNIAFSSNFFNKRKKVSIDAKDETIDEILSQMLKGTFVNYAAVGQQIIVTSIRPKDRQRFTISGYIEDSASGERLIGATVYSPNYNDGTTTNEYGFYSLTLPMGATEVAFKYIGYREIRETIELDRHIRKSVVMQSDLTLSEVVVLGNEKIDDSDNLHNRNHESLEKLKEMPTLGRGGDLMKQIDFLPGIESGVEGLGGMFVRGGNVDQNLMLMDGVNIYNPNHLLGLFSVYNMSAVKSAKLYKGDFPARYGGRVSSVVDVRTKEGNMKKYSGEIAPGFLSSRLTLEGPILKDKLAFFATTRFSHLTPLINTALNTAEFDAEFGFKLKFYDINAKLHYAISEKDKIFLSFYAGQDIITREDAFGSSFTSTIGDSILIENRETFADEGKVNWGNSILALRWNHLFNHQLFSNTTFTFSRFNFNIVNLNISQRFDNSELTEYNYQFLEYENQIADIGIKTDFEYIPSPQHYYRFGAGLIFNTFNSGNTDDFVEIEDLSSEIIDPSLAELTNTYESENENSAINFYGYVEDEIKISDRLQANIGLRISVFGNDAKNWFGSIEPRLFASYQLGSNWSANASITRTNQFIHLLTNSNLGLPIDVWIPSLEEIEPQTAWQETISLQYNRPNSFLFKVEGFYKKMNNLFFLQESIFQFESLSLSDSTFIKGSGESYGLEFTVEKQFKKAFLFGYYTLSKSTRLFSDFNEGNSFPFQYDRLHSIKIGGSWKATKKMNLGLTWSYHSGTPRLYVEVLQNIEENTSVPDDLFPPGEYNQKRGAPYSRLDFRVNFTFPKKRGIHNLGLSIYNTTFRRNATYYERYKIYDTQGNPTGEYMEDAISIAPIIPSLNYVYKF